MMGYLLYLVLYSLTIIISFLALYCLVTKRFFKFNILNSQPQSNLNDKNWASMHEIAENAVIQVFSVTSIFNWLQPFKSPVQVTAAGSGFFIDDQGYFVTNSHVVDQAKSVWVQIPSFGRKNINAEVIGVCPDSDLALLKIKQDGIDEIRKTLGSVPFLELGDSDNVLRTDKVIVLGYPLGQHYLKATTGVVSGKEHIAEQLFIQIDAAINPGSSGGPVINENGQVIGITTVMVPMAQNIGYIIPINELKNILDDLKKVPFLRKQALGFSFNNATQEQVEYLKNPLPGGLYVNKVFKDSIAQKAGLQVGDMIYEVNGNAVDLYADVKVPWSPERLPFIDFVSRLKTGQDINLVVYRNGEKKELNFKFENAPVYPIRVMYPEYEPVDYEIIGGMIIMELTENHVHTLFTIAPHLISFESTENQVEPALVISYLFPSSEAFRLRIFNTGDIIKTVNDVPVKTLNDFRNALKQSLNTGYLIIRTQDSVLVLNINNVLTDEQKMSQDYKYPISNTVINLLHELQQKQKA
jgi:serine protease Do